MKKILKAARALILATALSYPLAKSAEISKQQEFLDKNHEAWMKKIEKTKEIFSKDLSFSNDVCRFVYKESQRNRIFTESRGMLEYSNFSKTNLAELFEVPAKYAMSVSSLVPSLKLVSEDKDQYNDPSVLESLVSSVIKNPAINSYLKFEYGELDCRAYSAVAAAFALQACEPNMNKKIELVTGLFFHPKESPKGEGHQWIMYGGNIVDSALSPNTVTNRNQGYVPIVGVEISKKGNTYSFIPRVHCITYDLEREFEEKKE